MSSAQYQTEFNTRIAQDYRLMQVSGYRSGGQDRYAAIFQKTGGPQWITRHDMTSAQYQEQATQWVQQGYKPYKVSAFGSANNQAKFAAIYIKYAGSVQVAAKHDMTSSEYQTHFNNYHNQGFTLADVNGYTVGSTIYYAAVWTKGLTTPNRKTHHGMTFDSFTTHFNNYKNQGYRLIHVSGFNNGAAPAYAAIWEQSSVPAWQTKVRMDGSQAYQDEFDRMKYQGYNHAHVDAYAVGNKTFFAAIFTNSNPYKHADMAAVDQLVNNFMSANDIPGLSFAISRHGKLVLAKTYGVVDKSTNEATAPRHRFRIASVSKPITAAAIMRLVQNNQLKLGDRVFGANGVLGTTYGTLPYAANLTNITVEHLLTHTSGNWPAVGGAMSDPMGGNSTMNHKQLIDNTLNTYPLVAPGNIYAYSNFGYCLLGRIIEKKTGKTYEQAVKDLLLTPSGVTQMTIGGNTLAERKANEARYYKAASSSVGDYAWNVTRMDAHGGWIATPIDLLRFNARVDQIAAPADLLNTTNLTTMYSTSPNSGNYMKGWRQGNVSRSHGGLLSGSNSAFLLHRPGNGIAFSVVTNTPVNNIDGLMSSVLNAITQWPDYNLW